MMKTHWVFIGAKTSKEQFTQNIYMQNLLYIPTAVVVVWFLPSDALQVRAVLHISQVPPSEGLASQRHSC